MDELLIPKEFCESNADGLCRVSFLRSILWTTDKEQILFETLMFRTPQNIVGYFASNDYLTYEIYINLVLEIQMSNF